MFGGGVTIGFERKKKIICGMWLADWWKLTTVFKLRGLGSGEVAPVAVRH